MNKYEKALNKINDDMPNYFCFCLQEELKCLHEACEKAEIFDLINSDIGIDAVVEELESYTSNKKYYMKIASDYVEITKEQYDLLERILRREKPITAEDKLHNYLQGVAVGLILEKATEPITLFPPQNREPVASEELVSKDDHCPKCGKECKLDDITLHNCGWDARWCPDCGHTFYIEEPKGGEDE